MMTVFVQSLALASVGIISPGSITIVILLLMSGKGWRNGMGYALGYIGMYSAIGVTAIVLGLGSAENINNEQSLTTSIVLLVLGTLLLLIGLRSWHTPPTEKREETRFSTILNTVTLPRSFGLGAVVAILNVKNLAIFLTSLSILLASTLPIPTQLLMFIPLILIFCISVIAPVLIYIAFPARADEYLTRIKQTIDRYSRPIGIVIPILIGILLLSRGIRGLL